jgi:hypothetical protein
VTPTQQSVLIRRQGAPIVARPPEAAQTRQVVWKNTPPPRPATFASHAAQLETTGDKPVAPLPISQTRGAPRSGVTRGMSHTDGPATAPSATAPTITSRPVPNTRPNINVRSYPNDEAQPVVKPNTPPTAQTTAPPNTRPMPVVKPNVNVRPAPGAQPTTPPNTRPVSHTDVQQTPRTDVQPPHTEVQDEKKSPAQGEKPQSTQTTEAKRKTDERAAAERRRVQTEEKDKPKPTEHDDRPPQRH